MAMISGTRNLRSRGCHACIRRKVKCDERRPACLRCIQGRRTCPGYRTWEDLVLRQHQVVVVADDSWKQEALPCFLTFHTTAETSSTPGHMDFVLDLVALELNKSDCFTNAIMAASTTCLARRAKNRYPRLQVESAKLYGKALRSLQAALADPQCIGLDSTLASVILLSEAGLIAGDVPTATSPHHRAETALAKLRNARDYEFNTRPSKILHFTRVNAAQRSMCFPKSSQPFLLEDDRDLAGLKNVRGVLFQASHACTILRSAINTREPTQSKAIEALRLLAGMEKFGNFLPLHLQRKVVHHDKPTYFFGNTVIAGLWLSLWCSQIRLYEALQAYTSSFGDFELQESLDNLIANSDPVSPSQHILAAADFCLGRLDNKGNVVPNDQTLAHPGPMIYSAVLFVVADAQWTGISREERLWVLDTLAYIGHERGIGQALVFRDDLLRASPLSKYLP